MKAVLMSIKPQWCGLIASGKKTFELRKSFPHLYNLSVPFKVYIYETQGYSDVPRVYEDGTMIFKGRGKVIGEFVCDYANNVHPTGLFVGDDRLTVDGNDDMPIDKCCLTEEQVRAYLGKKSGIGWHISELLIYDQPKGLSEFWKTDKCPYASIDGCTYKYHCFRAGQVKRCGEILTRPPQSWCYVEK